MQPTPFYFAMRLHVIHLTNRFYFQKLMALQIGGLDELVQLLVNEQCRWALQNHGLVLIGKDLPD